MSCLDVISSTTEQLADDGNSPEFRLCYHSFLTI